MIIVSDTSCISNLLIIEQIDILNLLYGKVLIPEAVYRELFQLYRFYPNLQNIQNIPWIEVVKVKNISFVHDLEINLDKGESEAIALAQETSATALLMDEAKGRSVATKLGIPVIGLLGILIQAKQNNVLAFIKPILYQLKEQAGFWVSEELYDLVLKRADEA